MNIALILAGGIGTRLGNNIPKQYLEVLGKPVIEYCLKTFLLHEKIDKLQIVADDMWHAFILERIPKEKCEKFQGFSTPGANRQLSIWNGLCDIMQYADGKDAVIIHDAARPLVTDKIITDCLEMCKEHDGAMAALPVKDTVYYGAGGRIESLLNRDNLIAGQAPEAFVLGKYCHANEVLLPAKILEIKGSTEPAILAGMDVVCVDGDEQNFKITTREDLEHFEQVLRRKEAKE